jgi:hypothetical protein
MQTIQLSDLAPATLAMLAKKLGDTAKKTRNTLPAGEYKVDEIVTLKLDGTVKVSADGDKAPTCSIPMLAAMALLVRRMGIQREAALDMLSEVMREALALTKDGAAGEAVSAKLLADSGVADALEQIQTDVVANLPKTPVKGQVRVDGTACAVGIVPTSLAR